MIFDRTLLDFMFLPIIIYEIKTLKIIDVNQSAIDQYGFNYEEFLNLTIEQIRPPGEVEKLRIKSKDCMIH